MTCVKPRFAPGTGGAPGFSRRQALAGLAALGGLSLTACAPPVQALRVGAMGFPGYEFLFLARSLGLLDDEQVRLVEMRSSTDALRALTMGRLEAAALTLDEVLSGLQGGLQLRVVAVLDVSAGMDVLLARPPAQRMQDLRGLRVGVEDSAVGALVLAFALKAAGLPIEAIRKVNVPLSESAQAYLDGRVDAVVTAAPWASRIEGAGGVRLFDSRAMPGRIVDVLAVEAQAADQHGAALRALVRGHFVAHERFARDIRVVQDLLSARLQVPVAELPRQFEGLEFPARTDNRQWLAPGGLLEQRALETLRFMRQEGLLHREVSVQGLADARGLEDA